MVNYEDGVAEAKLLAASIANNQWRLGEILDQLETKYGEETLEHFAQDTGIAYSTLRNCRSVYRKWKKEPHRPKSFSVAKALVSSDLKGWYAEKYPDMTEDEAKENAREDREGKSAGKYKDFPIHKLVSLVCRKANVPFKENSEEMRAVREIVEYEEIDSEYYTKVFSALEQAKDRINEAQRILNSRTYSWERKEEPQPPKDEPEAPKEEPTAEAPKEEPTNEAPKEETTDEEIVVNEIPFKLGEGD